MMQGNKIKEHPQAAWTYFHGPRTHWQAQKAPGWPW